MAPRPIVFKTSLRPTSLARSFASDICSSVPFSVPGLTRSRGIVCARVASVKSPWETSSGSVNASRLVKVGVGVYTTGHTPHSRRNVMAQKPIAYVQASWHTDITDHCRQAFMAEMARHGYAAGDVPVFSVPGSLE